MTFLSIQVQEDLQFQFFLLQLINLQYVCLYHFLYKLSYRTVQKILKIIIHILQKKWSLNPKLKHIYLHVLFFLVCFILFFSLFLSRQQLQIFSSHIFMIRTKFHWKTFSNILFDWTPSSECNPVSIIMQVSCDL